MSRKVAFFVNFSYTIFGQNVLPPKVDTPMCWSVGMKSHFLTVAQLFRTCATHCIVDGKCAHFNALYYANALYVFLGFSLLSS